MNLLAELKVHALRSLARMGGQPMPDATLRDSLRLSFRHQPLVNETLISQAIKSLDAEGNLIGAIEEPTQELFWSLTTKGQTNAARFP